MASISDQLLQLLGPAGSQLAPSFANMPQVTPISAPSGSSTPAPRGANSVSFGDLLSSLVEASYQQDPQTVDRVQQWKGPNMVARGRTSSGTDFYYPIRPANGKAIATTRTGESLGEVDPRYGRLRGEVSAERRFTQDTLRDLRRGNQDFHAPVNHGSYGGADLDQGVAEAVGDTTFNTPPQQQEQPQVQRGARRTPTINRGAMATALGNMRERDDEGGSIF